MILKMEANLKKKIQHTLIAERKSTSNINKISKFILMGSLVGCIAYGILNVFIPNFSVITVNGIDKKDYYSIFFNTIEIFVLGFIISLFFGALNKNLSSKDSNERVDEELFMLNGMIRYSFRIRYQSNGSDRVIILIPLDKINSVVYTEEFSKLTLNGAFSSAYVEDYSANSIIEPNSEDLTEFVFYDYFKPSLLNELKTAGINISYI